MNPESFPGWMYYVKKKNIPLMNVRGRMCTGCHEAANDPHPYFDGNKEKRYRDFLFVPFQ